MSTDLERLLLRACDLVGESTLDLSAVRAAANSRLRRRRALSGMGACVALSAAAAVGVVAVGLPHLPGRHDASERLAGSGARYTAALAAPTTAATLSDLDSFDDGGPDGPATPAPGTTIVPVAVERANGLNLMVLKYTGSDGATCFALDRRGDGSSLNCSSNRPPSLNEVSATGGAVSKNVGTRGYGFAYAYGFAPPGTVEVRLTADDQVVVRPVYRAAGADEPYFVITYRSDYAKPTENTIVEALDANGDSTGGCAVLYQTKSAPC